MTLEEDAIVLLRPDPRLPRAEVELIASRLERSAALTPGFIAPEAGLLSIKTMLYAEHVDRLPTVLLPDRNVITRMARIARDGRLASDDFPSRLALDLMAYAQAMNVNIEPGLALLELAQSTSNETANEELRWFRAADEGGRATAWIDLAVGRSATLPTMLAKPNENLLLDEPLHRWRCNYAVMLKAASLELNPALSPVRRFEELIAWMLSDFLVAGPAAIYCAMFLSPDAPRAGLMKGLRSHDRSRALAGVRNAAWDATYLSELVQRAQPHQYGKARCIFASADRSLSLLAPLLLFDADDRDAFRRHMAAKIEPWWRRDAGRVADVILGGMEAAQNRPAPEAPGVEDYVGQKIAEGEAAVSRPSTS